jgi:hypothetical protein
MVFSKESNNEDGKDFADYVKKMRKTKPRKKNAQENWGGDLELAAAARLYQ